MSYRSRIVLRKIPKREQESRINIHSFFSPKNLSVKRPLLSTDDYQAPLTANSLYPESKWVIVRNNIHKIRSWGRIKRMSAAENPFQDWYLFFQMRRELKRTEEQIRGIENRTDFTPVRHFDLPVDDKHVRRFNVSHVQPTDGVYYGGLGSEPIILQSLLYYFSKECPVPYDSIFYTFLSDVNSVLDTNRQRINRVVVFRRVALFIAIALFSIILIMFFSLVVSVISTTSNLRQMYKNDPDGGIEWRQPPSLTLPRTYFYRN